jgi:hypothetical protein
MPPQLPSLTPEAAAARKEELRRLQAETMLSYYTVGASWASDLALTAMDFIFLVFCFFRA